MREKQRRNQIQKQRESFRPLVREKQRESETQRETEREGFRPIVREKQRRNQMENRERVLDR